MTLHEIEERIANSSALDFGTIFNESIELFKKVWVQGLVTMVITMAFMIPFYIIIYIPLLFLGIAGASNPEGDFSAVSGVFLLVFIVLLIVMLFAVAVVAFAMRASLFRIIMQRDLNTATKDDYFYFLKKRYIGKLLKLVLASIAIALIAYILCVVPIFYAIVPLSYITTVFAFNPELSASEIIKASFSLGNKKWLLSFGLIVITAMLSQLVGLLLCGIGIFVTASFVLLPVYLIYKKTVGFDENETDNGFEIDLIEN